MLKYLSVILIILVAAFAPANPPAMAQDQPAGKDSPAVSYQQSDADFLSEERLKAIFSQISELQSVQIRVLQGVVTLSGSVANDAAAERAVTLADSLDGVITVEDNITRSHEISTNVSPMIQGVQDKLLTYYRALPLFGIAVLVFAVIAFIGNLLANWHSLWKRVLPNPFLIELVSQAIKITALIIALIVALNLMGATALMGAILGGAGVLGLAIGFAVREGLENYISSVMLSIRQPFRANEHVMIDDYEGKVVRLTSRATILMTLDGNHLRIPNATVFKAVILNYTRNPERRFSFELGVDADDDPLAAISTGIETLKGLDFILKQPEPAGIIQNVGDSNIVINFLAWVDQSKTDFGKARGVAIARTKSALEVGGFSLPEPIYRLRLQNAGDVLPGTQPDAPTEQPQLKAPPQNDGSPDVEPDHHLEQKLAEERAESSAKDLLDSDRPVE